MSKEIPSVVQIAGLHAIDSAKGVYGTLKVIDHSEIEEQQITRYQIIERESDIESSIEPEIFSAIADADIARVYRNAISFIFHAIKDKVGEQMLLSTSLNVKDDYMTVIFSKNNEIIVSIVVEIA